MHFDRKEFMKMKRNLWLSLFGNLIKKKPFGKVNSDLNGPMTKLSRSEFGLGAPFVSLLLFIQYFFELKKIIFKIWRSNVIVISEHIINLISLGICKHCKLTIYSHSISIWKWSLFIENYICERKSGKFVAFGRLLFWTECNKKWIIRYIDLFSRSQMRRI